MQDDPQRGWSYIVLRTTLKGVYSPTVVRTTLTGDGPQDMTFMGNDHMPQALYLKKITVDSE